METEIEKWSKELKQQSKLRTYIRFKQEFGAEVYMQLPLSHSMRSIISRVRAGVLPLAIETGRYTGTDILDRLCTMCKEQVVETEEHFMFECQKYLIPRLLLLNNIHRHVPNFTALTVAEKMRTLMCDKRLVCQFGHFLQTSWSIRQNELFK